MTAATHMHLSSTSSQPPDSLRVVNHEFYLAAALLACLPPKACASLHKRCCRHAAEIYSLQLLSVRPRLLGFVQDIRCPKHCHNEPFLSLPYHSTVVPCRASCGCACTS